MRHGLTYLSEDRKGKALHVDLNLQDNLTLMTLEHYAHPLLDLKAGRAALKQAVGDFGIRTGDLSSRARMLSGGNQQKLALAKFLQPEPNVIVLDEPTRGVDVGSKRDIYFLIHRLAAQGRAVIVISSELIELIGLCHRVAVMRGGQLVATLGPGHRHPLKPPNPAVPCVSRTISMGWGRSSASSCCASPAPCSTTTLPPSTT
jgi:ribose transport system ATP-binding protein